MDHDVGHARSPKRKTLWMYSASPLLMPPCTAEFLHQPLDLGVGEDFMLGFCTPSMRKIPRDALLRSQFSGQKTR